MYPDPVNPAVPGFDALFGLVAVIVVIGIVVGIVVSVRNASKAVEAGQNPLTVEYDLALKALQSDALAPERSTEEKLAEIERLFAAGTISADERDAARIRILGAI